MIETVGCGRCSPRNSMGRCSPTEAISSRNSSSVFSTRGSILCMGSKPIWRINSCPCGTRFYSERGTSLNALTNYSRTKQTSCIHATAPYIISSWTYARLSLPTASLTTNQRHCLCMWKRQGNWNCLHTNLIPNSRSYSYYFWPKIRSQPSNICHTNDSRYYRGSEYEKV